MNKIRKVCTECGSSNIAFDAYAAWNEDAQEFEVADVMDKGHYCNGECEGPCRVKDVEIEDTPVPNIPTDRSRVGVLCVICKAIIPEADAEAHCANEHRLSR